MSLLTSYNRSTERDTDTFLIRWKSLLLPQTWLDRHQTCIRWSPDGSASRLCSRSRSRSKVTWYGHFCDVTKCLLYSTISRSASTCKLTLWSTIILFFQYKYQAARCLNIGMSYSVIDGLAQELLQAILLQVRPVPKSKLLGIVTIVIIAKFCTKMKSTFVINIITWELVKVYNVNSYTNLPVTAMRLDVLM